MKKKILIYMILFFTLTISGFAQVPYKILGDLKLYGWLQIYDIPQKSGYITDGDSVIVCDNDTLKYKIYSSATSSKVASWEQEIANDSENNWTVSFTIEATSVVFYNGNALRSSLWTGSGTTTLTLYIDTRKYDKILVLK
ncbi:MAG: hypothetical protein PHS93_09230 [Candidatus Omnitrophica bacterium]|nr:hypothetical protein [Candidatus Omnitrophota bacterium]